MIGGILYKYCADAEMRRLMKQESMGGQLATFALAAIFGGVAGTMLLTLRILINVMFGRYAVSAELQAAQYGGWMQTVAGGVYVYLALHRKMRRRETQAQGMLRMVAGGGDFVRRDWSIGRGDQRRMAMNIRILPRMPRHVGRPFIHSI